MSEYWSTILNDLSNEYNLTGLVISSDIHVSPFEIIDELQNK